jgi:multiple sugar transport system ATP-binding protein
MAHVSLRNVRKSFGDHVALDNLDLEIEDGQFFILLGPTGAGKTTTLRLIAGLERPDSGTIAIDHEDVVGHSAAERDVALVLQQYSLYPRFTVRENLEFPLKAKSRQLAKSEIDERVSRAAKILRVDHLMDRKTDRLSGGEMQRVSIGRAIVRKPRIFLMDEPLSNLDAKLRESLRAELKDLKTKLGATFLFVTHDQVEAMSMGDKIAVLNRGSVVQIGTPQDIYDRPCNMFVAAFVGSPAMNLFPAQRAGDRAVVVPGSFELALGGIPAAAAAARLTSTAGSVTLGIRAEDIRLGTGEDFAARVHAIENHGVEKIVTLRTGSHLLRATVPGTYSVALEEEVRFGLDMPRLHTFDTSTGTSLGV